jgi:hypothetical protein
VAAEGAAAVAAAQRWHPDWANSVLCAALILSSTRVSERRGWGGAGGGVGRGAIRQGCVQEGRGGEGGASLVLLRAGLIGRAPVYCSGCSCMQAPEKVRCWRGRRPRQCACWRLPCARRAHAQPARWPRRR